MEGLMKIKNNIRDFLRNHDEIVGPVLRFCWCFIVFFTIRQLFGYSEIMSRPAVIFLMAVLCSVLPDGFLFFVGGIVMAVNSFAVTMEAGAVFIVLFILVYCFYVKFFPRYAYAVMLMMVCYLLHIPYAAPIILGLVAGIGGMIPAASGIVLYYFADTLREISKLPALESEANQLKSVELIVNTFSGNKEMFAAILIACVTVLVTGLIKKFSFDYSMYVAIAAGAITNILMAVVAGAVLSANVDILPVVLGTLVGIVAAFVVRIFMGFLDYQHTEHVEYEDDDYYYYVKAVPKLDSEKQD